MKQSFVQKVYTIVQQIPPGKVATYGDIARLVGSPKAARAVGMAMSRNPDAASVPCHRVVGADGSLHGYAFGTGIPRKRILLEKEGVLFFGRKVQLTLCRWIPEETTK